MSCRILVIDNYDSFTYNLVQMLLCLDLEPLVFRNNQLSLKQMQELDFAQILISPGPRNPAAAGISLAAIERFHQEVPIFGVCLGMQCINEFFAGQTRRSPWPVHGKTSQVEHQGSRLFQGVPSPFSAARYHSLQALPAQDSPLLTTAWSRERVVMALEHPSLPICGVQFHPESFLTEHGLQIMRNFLLLGEKLCKGHSRIAAE
ncbi:MAG: aminodeoxychorismate/anthranilate synthase component II [Desulfohalobiaceae bacterium]